MTSANRIVENRRDDLAGRSRVRIISGDTIMFNCEQFGSGLFHRVCADLNLRASCLF
jgi:hypothetical protein